MTTAYPAVRNVTRRWAEKPPELWQLRSAAWNEAYTGRLCCLLPPRLDEPPRGDEGKAGAPGEEA